jgi:hypothetical protein
MLENCRPMSADERQRKCRAGGKGRHRGGVTTPSMHDAALKYFSQLMAAAQAAAPDPPPPVQAVPQPAVLNVSSMAA